MNARWAAAAAVGALALAAFGLALRPDPWSVEALWIPAGGAIVAWALLRALRASGAPAPPAPFHLRARLALLAASLALLFLLLPRWSIVAAYAADPARREPVAAAFLAFAGLLVLLAATLGPEDAA